MLQNLYALKQSLLGEVITVVELEISFQEYSLFFSLKKEQQSLKLEAC